MKSDEIKRNEALNAVIFQKYLNIYAHLESVKIDEKPSFFPKTVAILQLFSP